MAGRRALLKGITEAFRPYNAMRTATVGSAGLQRVARTVAPAAEGGASYGQSSSLLSTKGLLLGAGILAAAGGTTLALADAPAADPYKLPSASELHGLPKSPVTLYQYEVCPFCCKVRAFLDYHKIPYRCVEVNPLSKTELKWSNYKKVPVLVLDDGEQLNDSTAICSRLQAELDADRTRQRQAAKGSGGSSIGSWLKSLATAGSMASSSSKGNEGGEAQEAAADEETKWRRWVDDWYVRVLTVNIYRTAKESWQTFDYITSHGNFGWLSRQGTRAAGAASMCVISGRMQKKYGIDKDLRGELYRAADEWVDAVGESRPFMGGAQPNLADLAVFGVTRAVVGTDTFRDLMLHTRIAPWYERVANAVGDSARLPDEPAQAAAKPAAAAAA